MVFPYFWLKVQAPVHIETVMQDFYKGKPVLTRNLFGRGKAYYLATRCEETFLYDFYNDLLEEADIEKIIPGHYISDVMVKERHTAGKKYVFLMNFSSEKRSIAGESLAGYEGKVMEVEERQTDLEG